MDQTHVHLCAAHQLVIYALSFNRNLLQSRQMRSEPCWRQLISSVWLPLIVRDSHLLPVEVVTKQSPVTDQARNNRSPVINQSINQSINQ